MRRCNQLQIKSTALHLRPQEGDRERDGGRRRETLARYGATWQMSFAARAPNCEPPGERGRVDGAWRAGSSSLSFSLAARLSRFRLLPTLLSAFSLPLRLLPLTRRLLLLWRWGTFSNS